MLGQEGDWKGGMRDFDSTCGFPGEGPAIIKVDEGSGGTMCIGGRWCARTPGGLGTQPSGEHTAAHPPQDASARAQPPLAAQLRCS